MLRGQTYTYIICGVINKIYILHFHIDHLSHIWLYLETEKMKTLFLYRMIYFKDIIYSKFPDVIYPFFISTLHLLWKYYILEIKENLHVQYM